MKGGREAVPGPRIAPSDTQPRRCRRLSTPLPPYLCSHSSSRCFSAPARQDQHPSENAAGAGRGRYGRTGIAPDKTDHFSQSLHLVWVQPEFPRNQPPSNAELGETAAAAAAAAALCIPFRMTLQRQLHASSLRNYLESGTKTALAGETGSGGWFRA